jgi:predicted methyltransferase
MSHNGPHLIRSVIAALAGFGMIGYFGFYCRGRELTRWEKISAALILLAGLSAPFWWT